MQSALQSLPKLRRLWVKSGMMSPECACMGRWGRVSRAEAEDILVLPMTVQSVVQYIASLMWRCSKVRSNTKPD